MSSASVRRGQLRQRGRWPAARRRGSVAAVADRPRPAGAGRAARRCTSWWRRPPARARRRRRSPARRRRRARESGLLVTARVSAPDSRATRTTSVRSGEPPLWLTPTTSASERSGRAPKTVIGAGRGEAGGQAEADLGEVGAVEGGVVGRAAGGEDHVARAALDDRRARRRRSGRRWPARAGGRTPPAARRCPLPCPRPASPRSAPRVIVSARLPLVPCSFLHVRARTPRLRLLCTPGGDTPARVAPASRDRALWLCTHGGDTRAAPQRRSRRCSAPTEATPVAALRLRCGLLCTRAATPWATVRKLAYPGAPTAQLTESCGGSGSGGSERAAPGTREGPGSPKRTGPRGCDRALTTDPAVGDLASATSASSAGDSPSSPPPRPRPARPSTAQRDLLDEPGQHRHQRPRTPPPRRRRHAIESARPVITASRICAGSCCSAVGSTPAPRRSAAAERRARRGVGQPVHEDRAEQRDAERAADRPEERRRAAAGAQVLLLDAVLRDQHRGLHQEAHADAEHDHVEREHRSWWCPRRAWSAAACRRAARRRR